MAKSLKCCVCGDKIDLDASNNKNYPCTLENDKSKWVCSEFCWAHLDEIENSENNNSDDGK